MDKMKDIKLIALDLDGTTLADSDTLSKRTQTAIESAIKSGITVVAASGRPFVMMPDSVMNIVGLDYAITSNGAVISKCGKTVHRSLILPDDVLKILGAVRNDDVILEGFIDGFTYADVRYVHRPLDYGCEPEYFEYTRSCHGKIVDMRSFLSKHRNELDLISIISTDEKLRNRLWSSIEKACNSVEITTSTDHFVEIMSAEASKAKALLRLCDFLNIGMENVCACGNADNDADMIAESGLGAAVENASQKCLDRADIVIPSNNNDGVAQLIEKILKNYYVHTEHEIIFIYNSKTKIKADPAMLKTVLENLIDNAEKYSDYGSDITINVSDDVLSISNQCSSFDRENLSKLWQPYFRAAKGDNESGSGIGLSIVKSALEMHGFKYKAEFENGIITFKFRFTSLD